MTLASQVKDHKKVLHEKMESALAEFTKQTGLVATRIGWTVHTTLDANGNICACHYSAFQHGLSTGV